MSRKKDLIVKILVIITMLIVGFMLGTLVFYGIGNLIIKVFDINFKWTILHSICAEIVYLLLKEIFSNKEQRRG